MSPDFYSFERTLRALMAATALADDLFDMLAATPDARRPARFKKKSREQLLGWTLRARRSLVKLFGNSARFDTDDVNVKGADLRERNSGLNIELKTGAVTDANVGLSTMTWALEDTTGQLPTIMGDSMRSRRTLAQEGRWDDVRRSQEQTMEQLLAFYRSLGLRVGASPPRTLEHFARCVASGITKMAAAKDLIGKSESDWDVPVILHADWNRGWKQVSAPLSPDAFLVSDLALGQRARGKIARAHLRIRQPATGRSVLFYPNYKNSFKSGTERIPAEHWVETACFHVWIDR